MIDLPPAVLAASTVSRRHRHRRARPIGFVCTSLVNVRTGRDGGRLRDRAGRQPQAVLRRRGARRTKARPGAHRRPVLLVVVRRRPAALLAGRARPPEGAVENFDQTFVNRGDELFAPTAEGATTAPAATAPRASAASPRTPSSTPTASSWPRSTGRHRRSTPCCCATAGRGDYILVYGRPFSPMPAWGEAGGGPLTEQQLDNLIDYIGLHPDQLRRVQGQAEERAAHGARPRRGRARIDYTDLAKGEALFNLGLADGFAGGAYSCARCHTRGWSIIDGASGPGRRRPRRVRRLRARLGRLRVRP